MEIGKKIEPICWTNLTIKITKLDLSKRSLDFIDGEIEYMVRKSIWQKIGEDIILSLIMPLSLRRKL